MKSFLKGVLFGAMLGPLVVIVWLLFVNSVLLGG
jgi:hypothetical protein